MKKLIQNNFLKHIENMDLASSENLANEIYHKIHFIHDDESSNDWFEKFENELNLSLYKNGLSKKFGPKDYILVDKLNREKFIVKDRKSSRMIKNNSIIEIQFLDSHPLVVESSVYGDKIYDYLDLNIIAYYNKNFAKKFTTLIYNSGEELRFFKLFSYYTAKYLLDIIIFKNNLKDPDEVEKFDDIINFIYDSYQDFTIEKPKWA